MREIDVNEINNIRDLLCEMIKVAVGDARNNAKFKSHYKQKEIDDNRKSASEWLNGKVESKIKFKEICDALAIETEPIFELLKKENETLP
jgi:hypothetical protein